MPPWQYLLSDDDRWALVDYIKTFDRRFASVRNLTAMKLPEAPGESRDIRNGRQGTEPFLFAQPVRRTSVLLGRWMGEVAALAGSIVAGFGFGGAVVASANGSADLLPFLFFVAASVLLGAIFLSIAAAIVGDGQARDRAGHWHLRLVRVRAPLRRRGLGRWPAG